MNSRDPESGTAWSPKASPRNGSPTARRGVFAWLLGLSGLLALTSASGCGTAQPHSSPDVPGGTVAPATAVQIGKQSGAVPEFVRVGNSAPPRQLRRSGSWYVVPGAQARVASDSRRGIEFQLSLGRHSVGTGTVTATNLARSASRAIPVSRDRALFFANIYPSTDMVVSPGARGLELTLQLRGPPAPARFSWTVVGSETSLVGQPKSESAGLNYRLKTSHGSASAFALSVHYASFALDSSGTPPDLGRKLGTHLAASGDRVTVSIAHASPDIVYPVLLSIGLDHG
jgi:hypothetical protein